jgi:hypothetical protein
MAKRKAQPTECDCAKQVDDELNKRGIALDKALSMDFTTGKASVAMPFIAVHWKDKPKRGKRLPTVTCAFCPFCGKKKGNDA